VRILRPASLALALLAVAPAARAAESAPVGRHVVVVVWDGMRPDFVSATTSPNLWTMARRGVFFASHHPVYLSSTEVNGTAMATGEYPEHSTIVGNKEFRPGIDPQMTIGMEVPASIRRGDEISQGHYLAVPTLAEFLHAQGFRTAIAGSKQVALLHDRALRPDDPASSPIVFEGAVLPAGLMKALTAQCGDFPATGKDAATGKDLEKSARDAWTTRALIEVLWKDGVPPFSLLWLAEPDFSQHNTGPGSPQSLAAIKSSDDNLGRVLVELDRRGLRASTDVVVVSDHGFSTIQRVSDIAADLSAAGFNATRAALGGLQTGQIMVLSNGGTAFLYVGGHDPELVRRIAVWMQTMDWAGVIFSRVPVDGTFALGEAHIDSPEAPDIAVSLRWNLDRNAFGTPGLIVSDRSERGVGNGNHASLSATDMHNTLVAAGPDFRRGVRDTLPSANTDVAPTILWLLGFKERAARLDGRVLAEALTVDAPSLKSYELKRLTARRDTAGGYWEQYLQVSEVNGVRYLDEGNGAWLPRR
jgi:arylsulfatase A-like enzyme